MDVDVDRISSLPENIIDEILSRINIIDAVRSSILSSTWRYKWVSLPNLVFDRESVSEYSPKATRKMLIRVVDSVIILHNGSIRKFKLSHKGLEAFPDIDRWILFLARKSVAVFVLHIWKGNKYKIPSSLYQFQQLIHLELYKCILKPPPTFKGFMSLKSLDLNRITMEQDLFEYLISSCPLLEKLKLFYFDGSTHLNIHSPNILDIHIESTFEEVNFENTLLLARVLINLPNDPGYDQNPLRNTSNLIKIFTPLPSVKRFVARGFFMKYLAVGMVIERLPTPCNELKYLSISINFNDSTQTLAALCLMRSCPNLEELEIFTLTGVRIDAAVLEEEDKTCPFHQLRLVNIVNVSRAKEELNFIKFLLSNSPILMKMTVKPATTNGGWELLKELIRFSRASARAEIFILDP